MLPFLELYPEDRAQTSPVHEIPAPPFSNNMFDSPMTMPEPAELPSPGRLAEFSSEPLTIDDILYNFQILQAQQTKKALVKRQKKPQSRVGVTFKPYVSIESTEMTVHQLRALR